MTIITTYTCDVCGNSSTDPKKIIECECSHLGLSTEELQKWKDLKQKAKTAAYFYSINRNQQTIDNFNQAIEKLIDFEKEHKLAEKKAPAHC